MSSSSSSSAILLTPIKAKMSSSIPSSPPPPPSQTTTLVSFPSLPNLVDLCDEEDCAIGNGFFLMALPVSGDNNTAATRSMRDDRKRMFESPPSSLSKRTVTLYPRPLKKLKKASLLE